MESKAKIENEAQYEWACRKVDELLPLVNDKTPVDDPILYRTQPHILSY